MTKIETGTLGETAYTTQLDNGLTVIVVQKPGFTKKAGLLATRYGSVDMTFQSGGQVVTTPAGVAHFLEHKMFDMPDGRNVLQQFGQLGASPNAYTSNSLTAYHFETTNALTDCLTLLLNYVYTPFYTPESVEKEQGIISQELRMYHDTPQMRLFDELLALLYTKHPVRVPIGGTQESITAITADMLYQCYHTFYVPSNMVLTVVGDVTTDEVESLAQQYSPTEIAPVPTRDLAAGEPDTAGGDNITVAMDVPMPLFGIGVKLHQPTSVNPLSWQIQTKIALEVLSGTSSPLYSRLYADGLIDGSFGFDPFQFTQGCCMLFMGQSRDPLAVQNALFAEARRLVAEGIPAPLFQRVKRACWGGKLRSLDNPMSIARQVASCYLGGSDYFTLPTRFDEATMAGALSILAFLTPERTAMVQIRQKQGG